MPSGPTTPAAKTPSSDPRVAREDPSWGEERIASGLLLKLDLRLSPLTIRNYRPKPQLAPTGHPRTISIGQGFSRITRQPSSLVTAWSRGDLPVALGVSGHGVLLLARAA